jgi:hypothetical protein
LFNGSLSLKLRFFLFFSSLFFCLFVFLGLFSNFILFFHLAATEFSFESIDLEEGVLHYFFLIFGVADLHFFLLVLFIISKGFFFSGLILYVFFFGWVFGFISGFFCLNIFFVFFCFILGFFISLCLYYYFKGFKF